VSSDLLDQLAAYGTQQRTAQKPVALAEALGHMTVTGDVASPDDVDLDEVTLDEPSLRTATHGVHGRRRLVAVAAAAMVASVIGLIAVNSAVRDGSAGDGSRGAASGSDGGDHVERFRVNSDAAAYWRLTTLLEYDGERFRLPRRSLERVDGAFAAGNYGDRRIRQQVQILALEGQLVPAAADPVEASGFSGGAELMINFNRDTSTLVAGQALLAGDVITIVSSSAQPSVEQLRAATNESPDPILVAVPDDLPFGIGETAAAITDGVASPYDSMIALQDWFRTQFVYRLDAIDGHSADDLEEFLRVRAGDADQFSAAFALMVRTIGIPSRVAVGFTPGVINQDGWYSVTDAQSHSWPEVWFDDIGWIAFEPTPGRGAPGAEAYTGVPAQQDGRTATATP